MLVQPHTLLLGLSSRPCSDSEAADALALVAAVQGNQALKARLAQEMVTFLSRQCNIYVNE